MTAPASTRPLALSGSAADAAPPATRLRPPARPLSLAATALLLLGITAVAAFLRFWRLGYQSYWTDEGYTIERVRGTWQQLLRSLDGQGFPPGWYALLYQWCHAVEHFTHDGALAFSSVSTRSLTALFGTLSVPAIYWLARHFTDRRGALLAALLAAVNPFLIYYARDIKMYAAFYFFVILNMALFFQWLQSKGAWQFLWFPLYAICGAALPALHPMAWFIPALQLIYLLTRPRPRWSDAPLWIVAAALLSAFPIYWYLYYWPSMNWVGRVSATQNMGMGWLTRYTDMNLKTVGSLVTAHLNGFLWPSNPPDPKTARWFELGADFTDHLATRTTDWLARWELYAAIAFMAIMLLGLIPWRGIRKSPERRNSVTRGRWWWVALWIALPVLALYFTWQPRTTWFYLHVWHPLLPKLNLKPLWEPRYLGLIVPAWILWMAAALRRLPTRPVRVLAILFVAGASIFSALSNHLIYRNAPSRHVMDIAWRFADPKNPDALAIALPETPFSQPELDAEFATVQHLRPGTPEDARRRGSNVLDELSDDAQIPAWLQQHMNDLAVHTLVLTDSSGDVLDPASRISTENLERMLGPSWKRLDEEFFQWRYEWHYTFFKTWRTRVWQRDPAAPRLPPAPRRPIDIPSAPGPDAPREGTAPPPPPP